MASKTTVASADTWLDAAATTTNYGTNNDFYFGEYDSGAQNTRALIKWDFATDFAAELAQGYVSVSAVTVDLVSLGDLSNNTRTGRFYRVLKNWVETEATWNNYSTGNAWDTAGCGNTTTDRESSDVGSYSFNSTNASGTTNTITLTASAVEQMINGTFTNNGFLLKMDTETDDMQRFHSRTHATTANRPEINITYTIIPIGGSPLLFGGGVTIG